MAITVAKSLSLLAFLAATIVANPQVDNYVAGQTYFIVPPIPVYGSRDYRGIKAYPEGEPFRITWSTNQSSVQLVLAQEGNPRLTVLSRSISVKYFDWNTQTNYDTTPNNQTFFLLLYDNVNSLLATSQYFNITSATTSSTTSGTTSATSATSSSSTIATTTSGAPTGSGSNSGGSSNAVPIGVGVGVGVGAAILLIAATFWFMRRRRNKKEVQQPSDAAPAYQMAPTGSAGHYSSNEQKPELASNAIYQNRYTELGTPDPPRQEMP